MSSTSTIPPLDAGRNAGLALRDPALRPRRSAAETVRLCEGRLGIGLDDLLARLRLRDGEIGLLAGRCTEGLPGSRQARVIVLPPDGGAGSRPPPSFAAGVELRDGQRVPVRRVSADELAAIRVKMERCHAALTRSTQAIREGLPRLLDAEISLLHDLRSGLPLGDPAPFPARTAPLRLADLSRHVIMRGLANHYALREDVIAQCAEGDRDTTLWMLRNGVAALLQAELASIGETDPDKTWLLSRMRGHESEFGGSAARTYMRLLSGWPRDDLGRLVRRTIEFSDQRVALTVVRDPALLPLLRAFGRGGGTEQGSTWLGQAKVIATVVGWLGARAVRRLRPGRPSRSPTWA